jgi:hypothetical protein
MSQDFRTPYAGYDVLDRRDTPSWNEQTRAVVDHRLREVPGRRFLTGEEWALLEAAAARLLPQPDRPHGAIPIVPWIDRRLERDEGEGYRYADMPRERDAWRIGLAGIDEESRARHGRPFGELGPAEQDGVLRSVQRGQVAGVAWAGLPPRRFFADVLLKAVAAAYYAHPAAWSEIGFGGPASPRGYVRLGFDQRDPWEAEKKA